MGSAIYFGYVLIQAVLWSQVLWIRFARRMPRMLLFMTSVLMLLVAAIPHIYFGFIPGNGGEIIFMYGFIRALRQKWAEA